MFFFLPNSIDYSVLSLKWFFRSLCTNLMLLQHESYDHMLKLQRVCYHHNCNCSDAAVPSSLNLNSDSPFSFFPSSTPVCNHPTHPPTVQPVIRQIRSLQWTEVGCYLSTAVSFGLTFLDRHRPKPPVCPPLLSALTTYD